jgi:hypothetical protein
MAYKSSQGAWGAQAPIYRQHPLDGRAADRPERHCGKLIPSQTGPFGFQDGLCQGTLRPFLLEATQRPCRQQIVLLEKIDVSLDLGGGGDERKSDQEAAISTSSLASRAL